MNSIARRVLLAAVLSSLLYGISLTQQVHGDTRQWHRVVIDFQGPPASETADPSPFTDYRLNVTLSGPQGQSYVVPGYYAADGNAAETSAKAGRIWRVCFTPDAAGRWSFRASFRTGKDIAVNLDPLAGVPSTFDGASDSFHVSESDKQAPDHRARGLLQYVGEHYLKFAGTGEYFLKGGADSPENFLAYTEFDDSYDADAGSGSYKEVGTFIHTTGTILGQAVLSDKAASSRSRGLDGGLSAHRQTTATRTGQCSYVSLRFSKPARNDR